MFSFFQDKKKKDMQDTHLDTENPSIEEDIQIVDIEGEDSVNAEETPVAEEESLDVVFAQKNQLEIELQEAKEQNLRLQADFVNFRKRKEKEMSETIAYANESLLKQLLPVLDNFDLSLAAIEKTDNLTAIKDGIDMVAKNMKHTLSKIGLEPIHPLGQPFDMNFHEALTAIPVEEEEKKGLIIDVIEKGYTLKDRVIRVAKVVIGE